MLKSRLLARMLVLMVCLSSIIPAWASTSDDNLQSFLLCTSQGIVNVQIADSDEGESSVASVGLHCFLCSLEHSLLGDIVVSAIAAVFSPSKVFLNRQNSNLSLMYLHFMQMRGPPVYSHS